MRLKSQETSVTEKLYTRADWQGGYQSLTQEFDYWILVSRFLSRAQILKKKMMVGY